MVTAIVDAIITFVVLLVLFLTLGFTGLAIVVKTIDFVMTRFGEKPRI